MEPWLEEAPDSLRDMRTTDISTRLAQALFWVCNFAEEVPEQALWWQPHPSIAAIGTRLQHVIGSSERLAASAFDPNPDPAVLAEKAKADWVPSHRTKAQLIDAFRTIIERAQLRLREAEPGALDTMRPIGRKRIPVRRANIVNHIAEHATLHAGQLKVLLRLWEASR